jgi:hypothetical protein
MFSAGGGLPFKANILVQKDKDRAFEAWRRNDLN